MFDKIGFIGCGNMGGALLKAVASENKDCKYQLFVSGKRPEHTAEAAKENNAAAVNNEKIAKECSLIFLGVKPQVMPEVLAELAADFKERKDPFILVTMAAGLTIESIKTMAGGDYPVIRIMPNLPVSVGEGTTLYCTEGTEDKELDEFLDIMKASGIMCPVDEKLIDAGSAVSGCGPAFVYMFIEALADGGVSCGLPREKAQLLAAQTLLGSAKLLLESGKHPEELKDAVCSPGGTTIAGVMALEKGSFRAAASDAVIAAYEKTLKLKK